MQPDQSQTPNSFVGTLDEVRESAKSLEFQRRLLEASRLVVRRILAGCFHPAPSALPSQPTETPVDIAGRSDSIP